MNTKFRTHLLALCECSILVALAVALSFVRLWKMPMGGSVTLVSMLPIFLISLRHGKGWAFGSAFLYSLTQLLQSVIDGDVFIYCEGWFILVLCILFDYLVPFTGLAVAGLFKNYRLYRIVKGSEAREVSYFGIYLGIFLAILLRFACHYITGVFIWGQWAPEGMGPWVYSLLYNGGFLLPELIITAIVARLILAVPAIRRLLGIKSCRVVLE